MRTRDVLSGVAAVLIGGLIAIARAADPADSPDWWQAERDVTASLRQPGADLAALAAKARSAKPGTGREAMFNLCVLLRAGMNRDVQVAVKELKRTAPDLVSQQVQSIYDAACNRLAAWDVAQTVVEEFAANLRKEMTLGHRLLEHMLESGRTVDQIDQWLAHMAPGRDGFWVRERLRFNVEQGRGEDLVEQLCDQVRKNPDDVRGAIALLDALLYVRPSWKRDKPAPDLAWMSDTVQPKLATEFAELAQRLEQFDQPAPALAFYLRALDMPTTEKEIKGLGRNSAVWLQAETVRAMFDIHIREGIARCLLKLGRNADAQKRMVEAADLRKKHGLGLNALFAGQVQGASGERVIEGRIREKEKLSEDDPAYWHERARYYRGRDDAEQEEHSLKKALRLTYAPRVAEGGHRSQSGMRSWLVSEYASFLARHERADEAVTLLRSEIAELSADTESACTAADRLASDFQRHVRADDEVLWKWLAARSKWKHIEEEVLRRMLENAQGDTLDKHFSRAEQLVEGNDPSRAATLGSIMNRMRHPQRSIPLLEQAVGRAGDNALRRSAVFTLFESCLDSGDWRRAEALLPEAAPWLTDHEQPAWYSRLAVIAANAGAKSDALRIWKTGADRSPVEMRGLDALAKAGLREELADYYRNMHLRMPTSDVPPQALKTLGATR